MFCKKIRRMSATRITNEDKNLRMCQMDAIVKFVLRMLVFAKCTYMFNVYIF